MNMRSIWMALSVLLSQNKVKCRMDMRGQVVYRQQVM